MRAVYSSSGSVSVEEIEEPRGEGELIRVTSAGICGSDLHLIASGLSGVVLGHEFGGRTEDGRLVAVRPTGNCGTCSPCTRGTTNTCRLALSSLHGTSIDGGLADYVRVDPSRLYEMPAHSDPSTLALVEPLAVVIHGINRVPLHAGMTALVVGAGSIGLLTAAVLVDRGLQVDILCRHPHQRNAAESIGARPCETPGTTYQVSFDAVCTQQSLDTCINATQSQGSVVEFGMIWEPITLSNAMMLREISIIPSIFYSHDHAHDDFVSAIDVLTRVSTMPDQLVTHRFSLDDAVRAFDIATDRKSGAIKVQFDF
jgi:threonine dehydrogenase-like Zn-dependent dehydrogenase